MTNTLHKGTLKRWNDDKGFGFISSENNGKDIFVHISALKRMSRRPIVGDVVVFQTQADQDGKIKAINVTIEGVAEINARSNRQNSRKRNGSNRFLKIIPILLVMIVGVFVYDKFIMKDRIKNIIPSSLFQNEKETNYTCQGKEHCSEMISCEEAKFYLRNCPNTKMDGDGDGIPCENQWCSW